MSGKGSATAEADLRNANKSKEERERQYELYRVRWEAGGCRFGDPRQGNLYDPDGVLQGTFLSGTWGRIVPNRGVSDYGVQITLLLPRGMLWVIPESWSLKDINLDPRGHQKTNAFNALKSAVASWALESALGSPLRPSGFDADRAELVLAEGKIAVNLSRLKHKLGDSSSAAVPANLPSPKQSEALPVKAPGPPFRHRKRTGQ